jgi:hypothetical protein
VVAELGPITRTLIRATTRGSHSPPTLCARAGFLGNDEAVRLLSGCGAGTFLIRLSESRRGTLVLCYVMTGPGQKVNSVLVTVNDRGCSVPAKNGGLWAGGRVWIAPLEVVFRERATVLGCGIQLRFHGVRT